MMTKNVVFAADARKEQSALVAFGYSDGGEGLRTEVESGSLDNVKRAVRAVSALPDVNAFDRIGELLAMAIGNGKGETLLFEAARSDTTGDVVRWLLDNGCPLNARDGALHEPAIVDACRNRNPGALKAGLPPELLPHPIPAGADRMLSCRGNECKAEEDAASVYRHTDKSTL